ncbi:MAG: CDP-archaeol synthase [Pseudomonadota bacterium]
MSDALLIALYLQVPVVIGGVLHMLAVTRNVLPALRLPIHAGLFGANKTWRGVLLVPLLTAFGALCLWPSERLLGEQAVFSQPLWLVGVVAGLAYVLAELPNSWIKRRLGIAPGVAPSRWVVLGDQLDSGLGVALAYWLLLDQPAAASLLYALTFPITALLVKRLLYWGRLKQSAV